MEVRKKKKKENCTTPGTVAGLLVKPVRPSVDGSLAAIGFRQALQSYEGDPSHKRKRAFVCAGRKSRSGIPCKSGSDSGAMRNSILEFLSKISL